MRKALYYIFLVSAIISFITATYVDALFSRMFYKLGDHHTALIMWEAFMYWSWLVIALLLWLKKEWAIIPLVWQSPALVLYSYQVLVYNSIPDNSAMWCNEIAAITNAIMLIFGYLYYAILIYDNRSKILAWLTDRFGPVK